MRTITTALLTATLGCAMSLSFAGKASAAGSCVKAGGEATMVTEDLARFMAAAALKNSIAGMGKMPSGPVNVVCDAPYGLPHCTARQKACG